MNTANKSDKYRSITKEMADLYERKNSDYGDAFGKSVKKYGTISALTRISDKFNRLESLILNKEQLVNDESLEDTLKDLASYCIMTLIEMEEQKESKHVYDLPPIPIAIPRPPLNTDLGDLSKRNVQIDIDIDGHRLAEYITQITNPNGSLKAKKGIMKHHD